VRKAASEKAGADREVEHAPARESDAKRPQPPVMLVGVARAVAGVVTCGLAEIDLLP
jgi:hypothetical protein